MKRCNVLAALAILGMTAAATTPAMALENEFHGMYRIIGEVTNLNQTINTPGSVDGGYYPEGTRKTRGPPPISSSAPGWATQPRSTPT